MFLTQDVNIVGNTRDFIFSLSMMVFVSFVCYRESALCFDIMLRCCMKHRVFSLTSETFIMLQHQQIFMATGLQLSHSSLLLMEATVLLKVYIMIFISNPYPDLNFIVQNSLDINVEYCHILGEHFISFELKTATIKQFIRSIHLKVRHFVFSLLSPIAERWVLCVCTPTTD